MLLLPQHHILKAVDPGAISPTIAQKVFSNHCLYAYRTHGELLGRIRLCHDISMQACRRRLGCLNCGSTMRQHVDCHDGLEHS